MQAGRQADRQACSQAGMQASRQLSRQAARLLACPWWVAGGLLGGSVGVHAGWGGAGHCRLAGCGGRGPQGGLYRVDRWLVVLVAASRKVLSILVVLFWSRREEAPPYKGSRAPRPSHTLGANRPRVVQAVTPLAYNVSGDAIGCRIFGAFQTPPPPLPPQEFKNAPSSPPAETLSWTLIHGL